MRAPWALVPVKDPALGKSRLAPALDAKARHALSRHLARQTLEVCSEFFGSRRTLVVTLSPEVAGLAGTIGVNVITEPADSGLNGALAAAARAAISAGADGIAVIPTDLPLLSNAALWDALSAMPEAPGCLLVPDRHGAGTNLLAFSPPRSDLFSFGEGSLRRHAAEAARCGCRVRMHRSSELALDLDFPEDLRAWRALGPAGIGAAAQFAFAS